MPYWIKAAPSGAAGPASAAGSALTARPPHAGPRRAIGYADHWPGDQSYGRSAHEEDGRLASQGQPQPLAPAHRIRCAMSRSIG